MSCQRTEFGASLTRASTSTSDDKLSKHLLNCSLADDDDTAADGAAGVGVGVVVDADADADANDAHGLDGRAAGAGVVGVAGCVAGTAAAAPAVLGSRGANTNSPSFTSLCCSLTHCQSAVDPVLNRTVNCA